LADSPHYSLVPKDLQRNVRFREELLREAASDPSSAAQIATMCSEDLLFYVAGFCWSYDPRSKLKVVPFIPYGFQEEAMLSLQAAVEQGRDVAMPKSRDMGASWMGLTVFEWFWHFQANLSFLLVSRNEDYVDKRGNPKSLFWKIDFLHQWQPRWLLPRGRWLGDKDPGRKKLSLVNAENGSVIDGESTTGDAGRGDRRTAMFIDEHAAFELDSGFKVLRATRDTTNCRVFNSTPQGAHNAFHKVVHDTAAQVLRLHWSSHPLKNRGLYTVGADREVELLDDFRGLVKVRDKSGGEREVAFPENYPFTTDGTPGAVRSPWYDNECSRCVSKQEVGQELDIDFLGSDYPFFDHEFIRLLIEEYGSAPVSSVNVEFDRETLRPKRVVEDYEGLLNLWIELDGDGKPPADMEFVVGVDVSAGTGASNSALSIADRKTGEKVAVLKTPNMRPHPFAELVVSICYLFNGAYLVWDASGPTGQTFTKCLIAAGYPEIYYRRREDKVSQKVTDNPGYFLNPAARATLLEDYRAALADRKFINRSKPGLNECLQFIRRPDGGVEHSAAANTQDPSGARTAHGDEVIADALCSLGLLERKVVEKAEKPSAPEGSLAWRRKQRQEAKAMVGVDALGAGW
jgi:hypothetical protein